MFPFLKEVCHVSVPTVKWGESYRCTHAPARQRSMYTANVPHSFLGAPVNLQFSAFAARTRPTLVARNAFHGAIDAPSFTCLLESLAPMPVLESKLPLTMRFSPPYDGNAAAAQIAAIAARIIFASILVVFLSVVKDWACETLAVVRLLSCSNLLLLYACCRARKNSKRTTTRRARRRFRYRSMPLQWRHMRFTFQGRRSPHGSLLIC